VGPKDGISPPPFKTMERRGIYQLSKDGKFSNKKYGIKCVSGKKYLFKLSFIVQNTF